MNLLYNREVIYFCGAKTWAPCDVSNNIYDKSLYVYSSLRLISQEPQYF